MTAFAVLLAGLTLFNIVVLVYFVVLNSVYLTTTTGGAATVISVDTSAGSSHWTSETSCRRKGCRRLR